MSLEVNDLIRYHLAQMLKKFREDSGLTTADVGEAVGRSSKTVSAWENGRGQPDADMLLRLCHLYKIDSINVFYGIDDPSITLSRNEQALILAYRSHPDMQSAVRRLLGLDDAAPSGYTQPALPTEDGATVHRDPGDPAFREEIVRYAITQMHDLEPAAYNRVFHGASLEDAIALSLHQDPDNKEAGVEPIDQNQA